MQHLSVTALERVARAFGPGARVVRTRVISQRSTEVHALDVEDARGALHRLVLRVFRDRRRLAGDPWFRPENEATVLQLLETTNVPAPRLVESDFGGEWTGSPALLLTRLPGVAPSDDPGDMREFLRALARPLPAIHALRVPSELLPPYAPYYRLDEIRVPPWSTRPHLWERVLGALADEPPPSGARFIHRDYHQWNTLWELGHLTGVVDWTTGCTGPAGIDLARMRQNLLVYGEETPREFLVLYRSEVGDGEEHHPYWDMLDAVDLLHDMDPPPDAGAARLFGCFEKWLFRVFRGSLVASAWSSRRGGDRARHRALPPSAGHRRALHR